MCNAHKGHRANRPRVRDVKLFLLELERMHNNVDLLGSRHKVRVCACTCVCVN